MAPHGNCPFCGQLGLLVESHILPEFLHSPLYNDKGHLMAINGKGRYGAKTLQSGMKEHLFCEKCEQFFSNSFENAFARLWMNPTRNQLPDVWPASDRVECRFDYAQFKLFHLLNLYRAAASKAPTFAHVILGPHEHRLRSMIEAGDPGPEDVYPIAGVALYHGATMKKEWLISVPEKVRNGHQVSWAWMYGGVVWKIGVSGSFLSPQRAMALKLDGSMIFQGRPWQGFSLMHRAWAALADKESRPIR